MKRLLVAAAVLLGAVSCLSPGSTQYLPLDNVAPHLVSIAPDLGSDGGFQQFPPTQIFEITFSEPMDTDSLRPGIVVRNVAREEQLLELHAPDIPPSLSDPDFAFPVRISSYADGGFAPGAYQLILRTLLIDQQGNPLPGEFRAAFLIAN